MKFGKSAAEAAQEPGRSGGGDYIRYLKDGSTTLRILQEPDEWLYYWEHFSPAGFSFPCNSEEDCPGCTSDNEKMKKVNRKIAFNVLTSFNGTEYVNAFKIGPMVADKLDNRYKRFGTVTDRDYTITKYKTSADRWDFDVEGGTPTPVNLRKEEWKDIEVMLAATWEDAWGNPALAAENLKASAAAASEPVVASPVRVSSASSVRTSGSGPLVTPTPATPEEPPFEQEKVYREADLRAMDYEDLLSLIKTDMSMEPPGSLTTSGTVVDWLMALSS